MGVKQSRADATQRIVFEEFYNGGVVQASLPAEEWRGLHKFCLEHHIPKQMLLKLFRTYVPTARFIGIAEVRLSDIKSGFLDAKQQQEITDLFIPLVIHQDNDYLPNSHAVTDTTFLSRFIVQSFIIATESTHDLLHDFLSGVFGKRNVRFTNTTFLSNFRKLLRELCEDIQQHPTIAFLLQTLENGFKSMHQVNIVDIARFMLRYPAVSSAILHWRNGFRRKLFGEKMFSMRDPLPSKSFQSFGCTGNDRRQLPLCNPQRVGEALFFSGPFIPPEEGGVRRKQSTHIRKSFLRRSQDFMRAFSSSIRPETLDSADPDLHEWGFQTPEQAIRYTARVLLHDILNNYGGEFSPLPSGLHFIDKPVKLLSILTDSDCGFLKHQLGYKLLRGLIEDGDIAVNYTQIALQPLSTLADETVCNSRDIPVVPPSHREAFPRPQRSDAHDESKVQQPNSNAAQSEESSQVTSSKCFDVADTDFWVTDERLQRQFLYNPVTGERRWVVPVFDSHWEPVAAVLD